MFAISQFTVKTTQILSTGLFDSKLGLIRSKIQVKDLKKLHYEHAKDLSMK